MRPEDEKEMTQDSEEKQEESAKQEQAPKAEPTPDGLPKTQEELNALIEKRLARERKKLAKQPAAEQAVAGNPVTEEPAAEQATLPSPELEAVKRKLLLSQAQLAVYKSGARPEMAEDAVLLALHDAEKEGGEVTEEAVRKALDGVLKRHPEWKRENADGGAGGFQIGAPGGDTARDGGEQRPTQKRWNRFN